MLDRGGSPLIMPGDDYISVWLQRRKAKYENDTGI